MTRTFSFAGQLFQLNHKCFKLLLLFLLTAFFPLHVSAESGPLVKSIELQGNKRVSNEAIISKLKSRVGETFSEDAVREDIKKLYGIGYFDDIRVDIDSFEGGIQLNYVFKEKRIITSIDFQGNEEYETKDLKEKITITAGAFANLPLITDNVQKIISFYQSEGYLNVSVTPIIRDISEDASALTFQITEGAKAVIKEIIIEGNKAVSQKQIKKAMATKERWLLSFVTGSGVYQQEQLKADIERIKDLYLNKGFINIAVSEPEVTLSPDRENIFIKILVSEGDQYRIGSLDIKGNTVFSGSELSGKLGIAPGQIFNRSALRTDIDNIVELYMEKGYARAEVDPLIEVDQQNKLTNLTLSVMEGDIYRIGRIEITGNTKTRDKVIRREVRLDEGDVFNRKLLKRSYQRINNLNFFETVDIAPAARTEEKLIDLDVRVKEKLTGMLSLGGGYSSVDKFMVMGEITQANLFGKGLYLKFRADLSSRRTNYNISLRDPWFMDKPVSASLSLYNESYKYPDYDKKALGESVGFGKEISEYIGTHITYEIERAEITKVSPNASDIIKDQEGEKVTSSISPSVWYDTIDNNYDPTSGYRHALYTKIAGLGGDNYFIKATADSTWFFPAKWDTTFSLRGRAGYATGFAGKELPLYERYYVGGINSVRGLGFGEAGPRDEKGKKIGGNMEIVLNAEYIFPLVKDIKLKGVTFIDYGSAFDEDEKFSISDMRKTAGFGFRWMSPFGPIRLEYGYNLDPKAGESTSKLEFSIGGIF